MYSYKICIVSIGSCLSVTNCWWASWGPWTGHITPGTCGQQRRTRTENYQSHYIENVGSCNGIKSRCGGTYNSEVRTMCKCNSTFKMTTTRDRCDTRDLAYLEKSQP